MFEYFTMSSILYNHKKNETSFFILDFFTIKKREKRGHGTNFREKSMTRQCMKMTFDPWWPALTEEGRDCSEPPVLHPISITKSFILQEVKGSAVFKPHTLSWQHLVLFPYFLLHLCLHCFNRKLASPFIYLCPVDLLIIPSQPDYWWIFNI